MSDLREQILAWIDARLEGDHPKPPGYPIALRALRGEVEEHRGWDLDMGGQRFGACAACHKTMPCPGLRRIAREIVLGDGL